MITLIINITHKHRSMNNSSSKQTIMIHKRTGRGPQRRERLALLRPGPRLPAAAAAAGDEVLSKHIAETKASKSKHSKQTTITKHKNTQHPHIKHKTNKVAAGDEVSYIGF